MAKRPGADPNDGPGGKRIHFADESIHGPEHLRLVRRLEEMERENRTLKRENAEKDALIEQYQQRINDLNEENRDLHRRIKEKAINTADKCVQAPPVIPEASPEPPQSLPQPPQSPQASQSPERRVVNSRVASRTGEM
ncbi:hypothetical protein HNY73_014239 [Argiope bruennichi]|uniref:Uncharacterized protein n=1 Tax=Argiope bruennichi TaxID=94029 RepID=A0A8T0EPR3_ARGBR|nr:hypothetical protein HNY73_014239 [Argiope bruennichi]